MLRLGAGILTAVLASALSSCSGKTERGGAGSGSDAGVAQQPAAGPANVPPAPTDLTKHVVMVIELEPATHAARTLTARSVDLPLPQRRGRPQQAPWRVDVLGAGGALLFSAPLEDASVVRGEFRDEKTGQLSGVTTQAPVAALTLRLPLLEAATEVRVMSVGAGSETELGRVAYPQVQP